MLLKHNLVLAINKTIISDNIRHLSIYFPTYYKFIFPYFCILPIFIHSLSSYSILILLSSRIQSAMGNVCFDKQNLNKRKRPNRRSYLAPTKFYNPNSKLKLELFTWLTQDLPNLRNDKKVLSQQYIFDQEGQLMISEKTNEILFIPEGTPNNEKQIF